MVLSKKKKAVYSLFLSPNPEHVFLEKNENGLPPKTLSVDIE